ncbi:glycosyltransferase [Occallatibacter savannae]|uniref:glycosyltransferase n=1 Tax=Occallatibacter savannae TaxID=1002691 RepID=UPI000D68FB0C|nr:glycosyltransferase family 2 protein [Occallatibacter savannae]
MGFFSLHQQFTNLAWGLAAAWLWKGVTSLTGMRKLPDLSRIDPATLPSVPESDGADLTVIVPARDEEGVIGQCLRSLVESTGLRLQIIAVDDRSGDRTGTLMDQIAGEALASKSPHRVEVIHVAELPAGWLGKPHALATAANRATAPWILFTDGDVMFGPRALELAMREAVELGADHLVLLPTILFHTPGEKAVLGAMQAMASWMVRLWKVADPKARDSFGAGAFNLIRREVYQHVGGFEALRLEILEDVFLGMRVKRAGFAQRVILGRNLARLRWLEGTLGVVSLLEKNAFAVTRFRTLLQFLASLGPLLHAVVPLAAILSGGWNAAAGVLAYVGLILVYQASSRATRVPAWYALTFAPSVLLLGWAMLRSMVLTLYRGGVVWRGTLYPLTELRRAARQNWLQSDPKPFTQSD